MAVETPHPSAAEAPLETVLVPVDFSENSIHAVDYAIRLARVLHARVVLVHVYHFPVELLTDWSAYGTLAGSAEILEGLRKDREEQMAALAREKAGAGVPIEAPLNQWTWVPVEGAYCGDGSPTGFAFNPTDQSPNVLIFFMGGGACWDYKGCYESERATYIDGGFSA